MVDNVTKEVIHVGEMDSNINTTTIYITLINEGVHVLRPTQGVQQSNGLYSMSNVKFSSEVL